MTDVLTEVSTQAVVVGRRTVADGVVEFRLAPDVPLGDWQPGAHVDVVTAAGATRQYSLCGDPDEATVTIAVLREPAGRGGSAWLHDELVVGGRVGLRGPRNHFGLVPADRYLFLAGGIGITPLLPMLRTVAAGSVAAGSVQWRFCYGGRSLAAMAYRDEVAGLGGELFAQDEVGLLPLAELLDGAGAGTAIYCCGPAGLLDAVEAACAGRGTSKALHVERFAPRVPLDTTASRGFEVECTLSGRTVAVGADESVLSAVRRAGIEVLSSCEEGTCGTCETVVVDGAVEHRDSLLTEAEQQANEVMMICCSRARGARLVLEL